MNGPGEGRSFSPAQNTRLREMAMKLLEERYKGNRAAFARDLGVSGAALSNFLNGVTGAGTKIASSLAKAHGLSLPEIIGAAMGDTASRRPIYGNLQGWNDWATKLVAQGIVKPSAEAAGRAMSGLRVPEPVTMEFVLEICRLAERFDSPETVEAGDRETAKFQRKVERDRAKGSSSSK
jgi:hypothetical protein